MFLSEESQIKDFFNREVQRHFDTKLVNCKERIRVVGDLEKFRDEIKLIGDMKQGRTPRGYSVYFDDEFICRFDSSHPPEAVMLLFWRGLTQQYDAGKISFDKQMYKIQEEAEKELKRQKTVEKKVKKEKLRKKLQNEEHGEVVFKTIEKLNETA